MLPIFVITVRFVMPIIILCGGLSCLNGSTISLMILLKGLSKAIYKKLYETSLKELSDAVKNLIREHAEEQHQLCVHVISENNEAVQKIVAEYTEKMMVTVSSITAVYEKANHELKDIITQQSEVIEQLSNNNTTS